MQKEGFVARYKIRICLTVELFHYLAIRYFFLHDRSIHLPVTVNTFYIQIIIY